MGGIDDFSRSDAAPMLCSHGMNIRNLIVYVDGTANQFGEQVRASGAIQLYCWLMLSKRIQM